MEGGVVVLAPMGLRLGPAGPALRRRRSELRPVRPRLKAGVTEAGDGSNENLKNPLTFTLDAPGAPEYLRASVGPAVSPWV